MSWLMVCEGTSSRMWSPFRVGAAQPFDSAVPGAQGPALPCSLLCRFPARAAEAGDWEVGCVWPEPCILHGGTSAFLSFLE